MTKQITKQGSAHCPHKFICYGKKRKITTLTRCTECGQEEEHTEEN